MTTWGNKGDASQFGAADVWTSVLYFELSGATQIERALSHWTDPSVHFQHGIRRIFLAICRSKSSAMGSEKPQKMDSAIKLALKDLL